MPPPIPAFIVDHYEVHEWRHATAILASDYAKEWQDILDALTEFRLHRSEFITPGGSKSKIASRIDGALIKKGLEGTQLPNQDCH